MSEQVKNLLGGSSYNPDVLECLANLSNDEVFTPPKVVNQMLDMLPPETWTNPNLTFLDPACKTGVFLREIAKRLIDGLADQIPNLQERLDHIFQKQLYGIAITELTALASRRSLYCSKYANGKYSVTKFDNPDGNIRFVPINHAWEGDKCKYCGASASQYQRDNALETHAYEFIHTNNPEEIFGMKFDVIIGNPPYQLGFGFEGGNKGKARSIYHQFIEQGVRLLPKTLVMITPSRWMTKTADSMPEAWVDKMINCNHFKEIHDYSNSKECFPSIDPIKGGVSYFVYDESYQGKCKYFYVDNKTNTEEEHSMYLNELQAGVVIRDPKAFDIINKISKVETDYFLEAEKNFSSRVSPAHYFDDGVSLTSNWRGYVDTKDEQHPIKYYISKQVTGKNVGYIAKSDLVKNIKTVDIYKVFIPAAAGSGDDAQVLGMPFIGEPGSICSQTYRVIGYSSLKHNYSEEQCKNIISYIKTKFFRYLVSIKKKTQNGPRGVYQFVPLQDFSKPWTDAELYQKYNLTEEEINLIEENVKSMEDN
jgi:site-specific DNA-methyltransferase (adenine-specific)